MLVSVYFRNSNLCLCHTAGLYDFHVSRIRNWEDFYKFIIWQIQDLQNFQISTYCTFWMPVCGGRLGWGGIEMHLSFSRLWNKISPLDSFHLKYGYPQFWKSFSNQTRKTKIFISKSRQSQIFNSNQIANVNRG